MKRTEKKIYFQPTTEILDIVSYQLLCASPQQGNFEPFEEEDFSNKWNN